MRQGEEALVEICIATITLSAVGRHNGGYRRRRSNRYHHGLRHGSCTLVGAGCRTGELKPGVLVVDGFWSTSLRSIFLGVYGMHACKGWQGDRVAEEHTVHVSRKLILEEFNVLFVGRTSK